MEIGASQLRRPSWELWVVSVCGPRAGVLAVLVYSLCDSALRNFTRRLLKHDMFLWLFYAHLLVLYTISASCYAQTTSDPVGPVDELNARMTRAAAVVGASAAVAAGAAPNGKGT